jgi:hypothetical protein
MADNFWEQNFDISHTGDYILRRMPKKAPKPLIPKAKGFLDKLIAALCPQLRSSG